MGAAVGDASSLPEPPGVVAMVGYTGLLFENDSSQTPALPNASACVLGSCVYVCVCCGVCALLSTKGRPFESNQPPCADASKASSGFVRGAVRRRHTNQQLNQLATLIGKFTHYLNHCKAAQ